MRTPLCDLLGIETPIIQGSLGPWTSAELSAAISEAGALGSIGTALAPPGMVRERVERMRELTDRPFAINHTLKPLNEEAFALSLELQPAAISLALGLSRELVERTHAAGSLFIQQVHTVAQAEQAAEVGVDVIIAQGAEAGGFGGSVAGLALVPQVVDAVAPLPVAAAGGIADGRGLAAALVLGAQGVNVGTRFLASEEAQISDDWKSAIVAAASQDAVRVEFADHAFPPASGEDFGTLPRALSTAWIEQWNADPAGAAASEGRLREELMTAAREGRAHELVPFTGQTAGMIHDVLPVERIVRELVEGAEAALRSAYSAL